MFGSTPRALRTKSSAASSGVWKETFAAGQIAGCSNWGIVVVVLVGVVVVSVVVVRSAVSLDEHDARPTRALSATSVLAEERLTWPPNACDCYQATSTKITALFRLSLGRLSRTWAIGWRTLIPKYIRVVQLPLIS